MTCEHADRDAAYVLGSLSGGERLEFERHLGSCEECDRAVRRVAGLPGLLTRVDAAVLDELDGLDPVEPVPATVLPGLHRAARRASRRRLVTVGASAAVVAAGLSLGVAAATGREPTSPPPAATISVAPVALPMSPVGDVPVRADLALEPVTWGTRIDLACTYRPAAYERLPRRMTYGLFVRTRDGRIEQVGTWRSLEGRRMRLTAATATSRSDIASVEVRTPQGQPVLRLTG